MKMKFLLLLQFVCAGFPTFTTPISNNSKTGPCLVIADGSPCVPYVNYCGTEKPSRLVLGVPGMNTSAADFNNVLVSTSSACAAETLFVSIAFQDPNRTEYNLLGKDLVGQLRLNDIMDGFIKRFQPDSGQVTVVGFSKGAQAVQRYSLVSTILLPPRYLLGCLSSWTFLNESVKFRYGLGDFPAPFNTTSILPRIQQSQFLLACGADDVLQYPDFDMRPEAMAQGNTRLERAQHFYQHMKANQVNISLDAVTRIGHDFKGVIGAQGEYLCASS